MWTLRSFAMKPVFFTVSAIIGMLTFDPFATAGPEDCTPFVTTLMRAFLIESVGLEDAFKLLDRGDCVGALDRFEQSAQMGNLAAQNNVGVIYESGLGVQVDVDRARQSYRKAAEGGLPEAQWNLAVVILTPQSNVSLLDALGPIPKPRLRTH